MCLCLCVRVCTRACEWIYLKFIWFVSVTTLRCVLSNVDYSSVHILNFTPTYWHPTTISFWWICRKTYVKKKLCRKNKPNYNFYGKEWNWKCSLTITDIWQWHIEAYCRNMCRNKYINVHTQTHTHKYTGNIVSHFIKASTFFHSL